MENRVKQTYRRYFTLALLDTSELLNLFMTKTKKFEDPQLVYLLQGKKDCAQRSVLCLSFQPYYEEDVNIGLKNHHYNTEENVICHMLNISIL